jgi:Spy/CpxP family protein refolding chaperone
MLYRMHLLLTPEQRQKLEAWRERQEALRKDKDKNPSAGHRRYP